MLTPARSRPGTLGSMLAVPSQLGYPALFALIFAESAGVPLPGETALLTAGVLAGAGRLALPLVIGAAIAAAVSGDTLGYWLGRRGGRAALRRRGPFAAVRAHALERGERFFDRHGAKTVFVGRFVPGVRVVAAVLAGAAAMPWPRFAVYNLAGAFVWASTVASLASLVGPAIAAGLWVAALGAALVAALATVLRARRATNGGRQVPGLG
jgi:membrane protein DedA with SNARE-associated domain